MAQNAQKDGAGASRQEQASVANKESSGQDYQSSKLAAAVNRQALPAPMPQSMNSITFLSNSHQTTQDADKNNFTKVFSKNQTQPVDETPYTKTRPLINYDDMSIIKEQQVIENTNEDANQSSVDKQTPTLNQRNLI